MELNWQPTLVGPSLRLRPLLEEDFDGLYAAASDPLIWEQHPDRERTLMLNHAFQFVESVYFVVGCTNIRSQRAMAKIGGIVMPGLKATKPNEIVFQIKKSDWAQSSLR